MKEITESLLASVIRMQRSAIGHIGVWKEPKKLWDIMPGEDVVGIRSGLELAAIRACEQAGYTIKLSGFRQDLSSPLVLEEELFEHQDHGVLDFVRHHDAGLIRLDSDHVEPARIVAQVAQAWPDRSVLVVANQIQETHRVCYNLRQLGIDCIAVSRHGDLSRISDTVPVVVSTPDKLFFARQREIFFAMDATAALHARSFKHLLDIERARFYGFIPINAVPSPFEADWMAALFGFAQLTVPRHGFVERRVVVKWERISGGDRLKPTETGSDLLHRGIWHHGLRNRRIAKLATTLATQHWRHMNVLVLVANVEHAVRMAELLPNWRIETGDSVNMDGFSGRQKSLLHSGMNPLADYAKPVIVTEAALPHIDLNTVSAIIRADGGVGLPPITGLQLAADWSVPPLEIYDCDDRHHPELGRASRRRGRRYIQHGWFKFDLDPTCGRADRFRDQRPSSGRVTP